jgi:hypothetical protein
VRGSDCSTLSSSLPGLTRQSIVQEIASKMDTRVKPAYDDLLIPKT